MVSSNRVRLSTEKARKGWPPAGCLWCETSTPIPHIGGGLPGLGPGISLPGGSGCPFGGETCGGVFGFGPGSGRPQWSSYFDYLYWLQTALTWAGSNVTGVPVNDCASGNATMKKMLVTGYDNSYQSTGKNPGDPGYGITKSGAVAGNGTIAAPRNYPFRTQMDVPGYGLGTVLDRGGAIRNAHIDVWFPSAQEANNWGAPHLPVAICHD